MPFLSVAFWVFFLTWMLILFGLGDVTWGKTFVVGGLAGITWMAWYGIVMNRLLFRAANGSRNAVTILYALVWLGRAVTVLLIVTLLYRCIGG